MVEGCGLVYLRLPIRSWSLPATRCDLILCDPNGFNIHRLNRPEVNAEDLHHR